MKQEEFAGLVSSVGNASECALLLFDAIAAHQQGNPEYEALIKDFLDSLVTNGVTNLEELSTLFTVVAIAMMRAGTEDDDQREVPALFEAKAKSIAAISRMAHGQIDLADVPDPGAP